MTRQAASCAARVRVLDREMDVPAHPDVRTGDTAQLLVRPESMRLEAVDGASAHHDVSGDHGRIARWRRAEAERITRQRRPDLWASYSRLQGAHLDNLEGFK